MATESDKPADSDSGGKIEVSGKTWKAYIPIALVAALVSNSGSFVGCTKQDEVMRKLDGIEKKVDQQNEKISRVSERVARIEGARGAGSQ